MSTTRRILAALAASTFAIAAIASTMAGARTLSPSIRFQHSSVAIGRTATLLGADLKPNAFYPLLLAIPNLQHPRARALFGPVKTDSRGNLRATVVVPVVRACGRASVYAFRPHDKVMPRASVTLTGCRAPKHYVAPPPLPSPPKHKKRRA